MQNVLLSVLGKIVVYISENSKYKHFNKIHPFFNVGIELISLLSQTSLNGNIISVQIHKLQENMYQ